MTEEHCVLTAAQPEEFRTTGLLHLSGAFPAASAKTMDDQIWEFVSERDAIRRDDRST
jgi:hypothetical protein